MPPEFRIPNNWSGPPDAIANVLEVNQAVLTRDYHKELESGAIKANAQVAGSLFRKATGEGAQSVTAAIFWLKTRAGWKEAAVHEVSGPGGSAIAIADLSEAELDARIAELQGKLGNTHQNPD